MRPREITWIPKPSKLCNLRCSYCYEWDALGNPARISVSDLGRVFDAARAYHDHVFRRDGDATTRIVLHGGEPLALPLDYLRDLIAIQDDAFAGAVMHKSVQTNLYRVSEEKLELLLNSGYHIGVSFDLVEGVRLSTGGTPSERDVMRNIERLRGRHQEISVICVLARHTAPHVRRIHDVMLEQRLPLFVLPLQGGPSTRPAGRFELSAEEVDDALERLFVHWFECGCRLPLQPMQRYLEEVGRTMLGIGGDRFDRRRDGDGTFVVDTDLGLYRANDVYGDELCLGNLGVQSLDEILASARFERSLIRDEKLLSRVCGGCRYAGPCNGSPAFEHNPAQTDVEHCGSPYAVLWRMERYLRSVGIDESALFHMLKAEQPGSADWREDQRVPREDGS